MASMKYERRWRMKNKRGKREGEGEQKEDENEMMEKIFVK